MQFNYKNKVYDTDTLPTWAQALIHQLEREMAGLNETINLHAGKEPSHITLGLDPLDEAQPFYVPDREHIVFHFGEKLHRQIIYVTLREGLINIQADTNLKILPWAANMCKIGLKDSP